MGNAEKDLPKVAKRVSFPKGATVGLIRLRESTRKMELREGLCCVMRRSCSEYPSWPSLLRRVNTPIVEALTFTSLIMACKLCTIAFGSFGSCNAVSE